MVKVLQQFRKCVDKSLLCNIMVKYISRTSSVVSYCSNSSINSPKSNQKMSLLYRHLYSRIIACGPITVVDYMKEVLTHPIAGYYITKDVFGQKGDFTTSPEITQLFGEMIAVWIINEWHKITNNPFQLVELGPGRGSLMQDILRVFKRLQILHKVSIHLVEISPALSLIQAEKLCVDVKDTQFEQSDSITYYREGVTKDNVKVFWYYSVSDVPKAFSVFLAHEFFDALPIHKFQRTEQGWREILVDVIQGTEEEKFRYVLSHFPTPACHFYISKEEKRSHIEVSPQTMVITEYISTFLMENGGFALFVDYGHNGEKTDTFRAFREHKVHDPLLQPGSADLTADVDFSIIKRIAQKDNKVITFGPISQHYFLTNLGIDVRLRMLLTNASEEQKQQINEAYSMIVDDHKMGERFKVLSLFPSILQKHLDRLPAAGFDVTCDDKV